MKIIIYFFKNNLCNYVNNGKEESIVPKEKGNAKGETKFEKKDVFRHGKNVYR